MGGLSASNLTLAFGLLGNFASFMVYLAPLPTFYQVYKKKSTEGFQSIPYVAGLLSAMLWIYYALLKSNCMLLITINSAGCFIETIYICFYLFYAPKTAKIQTMKLLVMMNVVGFGLTIVLNQFLVKGSSRVHIVGWICLVISLCVFVAPLCVVREVIKTRSVEYMPFLLSLFLTLSAVTWFFYGLLMKDFIIVIPNMLGFIFGVIQMGLYLKYKNENKVVPDLLEIIFGVIQMVLYLMYMDEKKLVGEKVPRVDEINRELKEHKKLPELREQVIDIVKLPELREQIIDVVKLKEMMPPDRISLLRSKTC